MFLFVFTMESGKLNQVNFLLNAATTLPTDNHAQKLLKSYYLTKCRRLTRNNEEITRAHFTDEEICRKCSTPWFDANYKMSISPIAMTKNKSRKILNAIESKTNPDKQRIAKKSAKKVNNQITIECNLCHHKNKTLLWKKLPTKKDETESKKPDVKIHPEPLQSTQKKKQKRKKDPTAGLLINPKKFMVSDVPKSHISNPKIEVKQQPTVHVKKAANQQKTANIPMMKKKPTAQLATNKKFPHAARSKSNLLQLVNALKNKNNPNKSNKNDALKKLLK